MPNRRDFLKNIAGVSAGALLLGRSANAQLSPRQPVSSAKRAPVRIRGRRVKTVDVHCHITVPEAMDLLRGTPLEEAGKGGPAARYNMPLNAGRLTKMDEMGVDVQVVSINSFWYSADRDLVTPLVNLQNEKLAAMVKSANPDRFFAFATVALQFPELAAQQLEEGVKRWGLRGAAIGPTCQGQELSSPRFDPFWAKAEELQAVIFVHPQDSANATGIAARVQGSGDLANVIGNPLETTIFLSHMIFDGTLDRFPNLKILAAHGGGYLPSYANRMDHGCVVFPEQCKGTIKKQPTEYLKQIYYDSIVFTPEALRHLVATVGAGQIGIGTDFPFPWTGTPVDQVMATPGLSDADRTAILGGTMCKLLKIPA